ncbi:hypothetical protein L0B70_00560 [Kaistella sp. 97-N-M2]|uniref:hypothetical protein n=1 Tax=Kaistella sp. 97-N-M2 TaxID=2908645 RepID=UPI001F2F78C0|nr:hypothetical protein [Kaistella sp. 97-N-M2]UJF29920.1 hypothetical protein L0B70_00560 [Kaistella sp. 97-N-M2]
MEIKFYSDEKVLDLTGQKITVQDSNSRMNDKMFSKYFFPFEIYMDEEFINSFGDYESDDSSDLEDTFEGILLFENKVHKAKLVLSDTEGKLITGQIDFGFEDLPNFDKKLSELPLEKFDVADIYVFAKNICAKKYPETNFNFPRMFTSKYSPDDELWSAFNGYYNDLTPDGSEMNRNSIDLEGNIFNANIIHPAPHVLYVLKTGFLDAGLTLQGEILDDPIFAQRWIFSGTEYFSRLTQLRTVLDVSPQDYYYSGPGMTQYLKSMTVAKAGKYNLVGFMESKDWKGEVGWISVNSSRVWVYNKTNFDLEKRFFNIEITTTQDNILVEFYLLRGSVMGVSNNVIHAELINKDLADPGDYEGEDNGVITNLNEIDLTKAVPNITFGDLINIFRNRFNYGIEIVDNTVLMYRIGKDPENVKDFTRFEVSPANRNKKLLQKRSFVLRSTDLDDGPQPSMYYDKEGPTLNKAEKEETIIIESNVVIVQTGVALPQGQNTAIIKKDTDDALQLVYYDGLTGVQNNAKNPAGAEYPELFYTHWEKWLRQRIIGKEFQWKFSCPADEFDFLITDQIFCYKNIHNIKSWTKDLVENTYEVDIVTETIQ